MQSHDPDRPADTPNHLPDRRHPHRLSRETYLACPGPIHVATVVKNELPLLCGIVAHTAIEVLLRRAVNAGVTIHAYCAMSTHLHFVMTLDGENGPGDFLRSFKSGASYAINRLAVLPCSFGWQRSYYDTHAEGSWGQLSQIRYVLMNPVEAGLCEHWREWPYSAWLSTPLY